MNKFRHRCRAVAVNVLEALGLRKIIRDGVNTFLPSKLKKGKLLQYSLRHKSHNKRNQWILERLPPSPAWVLDIGSNTGETANLVASAGHYVLGCEMLKAETQRASQNASSGAAFMNTQIDPSFLAQMPNWETILLLSVLHRVYAHKGPQAMRETLRLCGEKTGVIFVEGATRHARYTDKDQLAPEFVDLDVDDCDRWHREVIRGALGESWSISDLVVLEQSELEPFRITYKLVKC